MKKNQMMHGMLLLLGMAFVSCSQVTDLNPENQDAQGQLSLILNSNTDFLGATRAAVNEESYKNTSNYDVVILDKSNTERMNCKASEIESKMPITLPIGAYVVKAFYGTDAAYSRSAFYVYGEAQGTIKAEQRETITLNCTPTSGKITVNFDENMSNYYTDYKVFFKGTEALGSDSISWTKTDTDPYYVKLNIGGETVKFAIHATAKDGFANTNGATLGIKVGSFKLDRNKAYKMNVSANHTPTGDGAIDIKITIDETTENKEYDIEVPVTWL